MFVFPANDAAYRKRKKAFVACKECKRGRRRCIAAPAGPRCVACIEHGLKCSLAPPDLDISNDDTTQPEVPSQDSAAISISKIPKGPEETTSTRFVSRLDPSSDLLAGGNPDRDSVGVWLNNNATKNYQSRKAITIPSPLDNFLLAHLNSIHAFDFPNEADRAGLLGIYFEYIHPLLPIVNKGSFLTAYEKGNYSTPLLHSILLVAARHPKATDYLAGVHPRSFTVDCDRKIKALLYAGIETGPLNLCRIRALLSMHNEGPVGFTDGSYNLACAFHHAHAIGIHLRRSDGKTDDANSNLWWSLWCLDKMSVCMHSGPINSHPKDVGLSIDESSPTYPQCARLLKICMMIDEMIEQYRPYGDKNIPEVLINNVRLEDDDGNVATAFLRIVHNVAVILSYKRNEASETEHLVAEMLLNKCVEIYDIVQKYIDTLPPFPIVPYSVSLTFTVFLKYYALGGTQATSWRRGCEILEKLSGYWWAAEAFSSMGRSVFERLEAEKAQESETANNNANAQDIDIGLTLQEILFDGTEASFAGQTSLFSELDKSVVDYWFPANSLFDLEASMADQ